MIAVSEVLKSGPSADDADYAEDKYPELRSGDNFCPLVIMIDRFSNRFDRFLIARTLGNAEDKKRAQRSSESSAVRLANSGGNPDGN